MNDKTIEEGVLGRFIIWNNLYFQYATMIRETSFYFEPHRKIWRAMQRLSNKATIDVFALDHELKAETPPEEGWSVMLLTLQEKVANERIEYYVTQLLEMEMKRNIEMLALKIKTINLTDPIDTVLKKVGEYYQEAVQIDGNRIEDTTTQIKTFIDQLQESDTSRIRSSIEMMTKFTGGYQPGQLIIFAARPAMGKTAAMIGEVMQACYDGKSVHVVSAEMTASELIGRMIIQLTKIDSEQMRRKRLSQEEWIKINKAAALIEKWNLTIDESVTLPQIQNRIQVEAGKRKIDLIAVDYIQRISGTKDMREQEINEIATAMKNLAKQHKCTVIALSQLNRKVEERGNKQPMLSDLRESGSIEQEADMVCFLHRPEYYGLMEFDDGSNTEGKGEWIIAKNRAGSTGKMKVSWIPELIRYADDVIQEQKNSAPF